MGACRALPTPAATWSTSRGGVATSVEPSDFAPFIHPQVYDFNVPTFGKGVVYDVDQRVRSEQFRFVADALRTAKLRTYVPAFKQVGGRCACACRCR